jgi:2-polyprenyl-3-methyl-5-hydroxy-6-metoxy-1,4-benzoquinol methylase
MGRARVRTPSSGPTFLALGGHAFVLAMQRLRNPLDGCTLTCQVAALAGYMGMLVAGACLPVPGEIILSTAVAACPLGHGSVRVMEQVETAELAQAWRRRFGLSASCLVAGTADRRDLDFCECGTCRLRFFHPLIAGDADFYRSLARSHWWGHSEVAFSKPEWDLALRYIKPGDAVLDVGCGGSRFDRQLPERCSYVGLELNADQVAHLKDAGTDARLESIQDHAKDHQGRYDAVCMFQIIEHVADVRSFVSACAACVQPGGLLIVGCPNGNGFLRMQCDNLMNMPPHHVTWWSREPLEYLGHHLNMTIEAMEESELEKEYLHSFMRELWMRRLFVPADGRQFALSGSRYRLSEFAAKVMSRLTRSWISSFAPAIKGHTITVAYRNVPAAKSPSA